MRYSEEQVLKSGSKTVLSVPRLLHVFLNYDSEDSDVKRAIHQPIDLVSNSHNEKHLGLTSLFKQSSSKAVRQHPKYRVPAPKKEIICRIVDELLEQDVIRISTSEDVSPVVLIKNPNCSDRMCVEYL